MLIKLLKPHTHASRTYPAGAELELRDDKAQWLIAKGIAAKAAAAVATTKEQGK